MDRHDSQRDMAWTVKRTIMCIRNCEITYVAGCVSRGVVVLYVLLVVVHAFLLKDRYNSCIGRSGGVEVV